MYLLIYTKQFRLHVPCSAPNNVQTLSLHFCGIYDFTSCNTSRFDLYLDETTKLSSNPSGPASCWYPAVFPLSCLPRSYLPKGQSVRLELLTHDDYIEIKWLSCDEKPTQPDAMELSSLSLSSHDKDKNSEKGLACDDNQPDSLQKDSKITDTTAKCDIESNCPGAQCDLNSEDMSSDNQNEKSVVTDADVKMSNCDNQQVVKCCQCEYNKRSASDHLTANNNKQVYMLSSQEIYRFVYASSVSIDNCS